MSVKHLESCDMLDARATKRVTRVPVPTRKKITTAYPALDPVLANVREGLRKRGRSHADAAELLDMDRANVTRMLNGQHPMALHYLIRWISWLEAPLGWPLLSWDTAEKLFALRQANDTGSGPKHSH